MRYVVIIFLLTMVVLHGDTFTVETTSDTGEGSFRWCIEQANSNPGPDTILFVEGGPDVTYYYLYPKTPYPSLTDDGTVIDGRQCWDGGYLFILGDSLPSNSDCLTIDGASDCAILGLRIRYIPGNGIVIKNSASNNIIGQSQPDIYASDTFFLSHNEIVSCSKNGILIMDSDSNEIYGNYIGVKSNGEISGNGYHGIQIAGNSSYNIIGDHLYDYRRNHVGGNEWSGIAISGNSTSHNIIDGNYIGLFDNEEKGNKFYGIHLADGTSYNTVSNNYISGNDKEGIYMDNAAHNTIQNNLIGFNGNNETMFNGSHGIYMNNSTSNTVKNNKIVNTGLSSSIYLNSSTFNTLDSNFISVSVEGDSSIGSLGTGIMLAENSNKNILERNVIGASLLGDIGITNSDSNTIILNLIGVSRDTSKVFNNINSISITANSDYNTIGDEDNPNIIGIGSNAGIYIEGGNNNVVGNSIGVYKETDLGNASGYGILIKSGGSHNIIEKNTISNGKKGVVIAGDDSDNNRISENSIYGNGDIGIDLGDDGVTENDSKGHTGPNQYMNYPVITKATTNKVEGEAEPGSTVELYISDNDPSNHGEGKDFKGSTTAGDDGKFTINITLEEGVYVTTLAIDQDNNTSEFSENKIVEQEERWVKVEAPNGGEVLYVNDTFRINYSTSEDVEKVTIQYSVDGGNNWLPVATEIENTGYYDWVVPDNPSETSLIKIMDADSVEIYDVSDSYFTITRKGVEERGF